MTEQKQVAVMSLYMNEGKTTLLRHLGQLFATKRRVQTFVADWATDGRLLELEGRHPHAFQSANGQSFVDGAIDTTAPLVFVDVEGAPPPEKAQAVAGVDMVLVPTNASDKSLKGMHHTLRWLEAAGVPRESTYVVFSNVAAGNQDRVREVRRNLSYMGVNALGSTVRHCAALTSLEADGLLATDVNDDDSTLLVQDFDRLAGELWGVLNGA